tara:strand:+ start:1554 stop:1712 length:159 start_codon:yes stop_codon:yes gene_type:complete
MAEVKDEKGVLKAAIQQNKDLKAAQVIPVEATKSEDRQARGSKEIFEELDNE